LNELGIVAALRVELRPLRSISGSRVEAGPAGEPLIVASGMGRAAAAAGARRLVEAGARALMSWGLAGGLDPALAAGTIVLPHEVLAQEGPAFATSSAWREQLHQALAAATPVCGGRLLTCREVIGSPSDKANAWRRMTAVAVDMESAAIAEIAAEHRLPFLAVRAVVDTATDTLPSLLSATAAGDGLRGGTRFLGALARAPGELPDFIRLFSRYRAASRALALAARSGALGPPRCSPNGCATPV
jgi:adenosylhomocysteine nucleosidase